MKKTRYWACAVALAVAAWPLAPPTASPRCYPTNRFVILNGGLVRDTLTQLVWQQQASSSTMDWASAQTYCLTAGVGFRLPTVKELASLVDLTLNTGPTIDRAAFPGTPAEGFWTSSPYAGVSGRAWYVHFNFGNLNHNDVGSTNGVRCVR